MDKQREKLIELISEYHDAWKHGEGDWKSGLADHLLANGVIVPTVKLRQTVYLVLQGSICKGEITHIEHSIYTTPSEWVTVKYTHPLYGRDELRGRTDLMLDSRVFLSREDAEKALASATDTNVGDKGVE